MTLRIYTRMEDLEVRSHWKNVFPERTEIACAILAVFGTRKLANGFIPADGGRSSLDGMEGIPFHSWHGDFRLRMCTQDEVYRCAAYMFDFFEGTEPGDYDHEVLKRVTREVDISLKKILPHGCRKAGLVTVSRDGESGTQNTPELCNLLYWPLRRNLEDISVLANGRVFGHETFALVQISPDGVLHRVGNAVALEQGMISDLWEEQEKLVEGSPFTLESLEWAPALVAGAERMEATKPIEKITTP
jgi:hypothetical protein